MIPLKLELRNFLSYGDTLQTIDFKNHTLICLSGKNGNGKSALLDAITWAIWGQARKIGGTSKADEGLLRLGQTRMMVALTFMLNHKTYRVRREFAKTHGKPFAALDFEVFDEESNFFRSLTDKTIRATQEVIERTINLDFDTFVNSAFLRQGQSNEFSKKTAKERKQILANILGLGRYDLLQQQANAEAKKLEHEKTYLEQITAHLNKEICLENDLHIELETIIKKLEIATAEYNQAQELTTQQERLLQQQENQQKLKAFLLSEQESISQRTSVAAAQLQETRRSWQELRAILRNQPTPEELEARRTLVLHEKKEQTALVEKLTLLEKEFALSTQALQSQKFTLEQEHNRYLQDAILTLEKLSLEQKQLTADHTRLENEYKELTQNITACSKILVDTETSLQQEQVFQTFWHTTKNQFEKRRSFYQRLVQLGNQDKLLLKELEQKKLLLTCKESAACPLCCQPLSTKAHTQVIGDLEKQEHFLNHRLLRTGNLLKTLKAILVEQHEQCAQLEKQALFFAQLHTILTEKKAQLSELETKKALHLKKMSELNTRLEIIATQYAQAEKTLRELEEKVLKIINHPSLVELEKKLQALQNKIRDCQEKSTQFIALDEMIAQLETLQQATTNRSSFELKLTSLQEKSYELLANLRLLKQQSASYLVTLSELQTIDTKALAETLTQQRAKKDELERYKAGLTLEQGRIINSLDRIELLKKEVAQKLAAIRDIQIEIDDFASLAFAFGKNGIQALLIEESIPEIEQEANDLLAKLTDNQSQIFIESLRDLKSGGVKETLEIKVADAAGIRPYEMFSGGEAFRVDFALRIAISKLLARRAGTALQTLIIDEGFGSQDDEGLSRIMNALYAIQDCFSKIIVVSHLNEFKENFPVHFIVDKTSSGSSIRVEERG